MSKKKKALVGKIGFCDNSALGIPKPGGHYVYIRGLNGDKCDVNVVTSLERYNMPNPKNNSKALDVLSAKKVYHVRKGDTYPIPIVDANFTKWSGINYDSIKNVKISNIQDIGKKQIKRKHQILIGKFSK
jgi:hypothetical protein